ncbi:MAG: patatin-like phospholipase family protein [Pseudomonadota bacterium]
MDASAIEATSRPAERHVDRVSRAGSINLALQGGGAHGAFTWGVLDRLLEDKRLAIEGISATSAGAMNGAVLVYGMMEGGRQGARALLRRFWELVSEAGRFSVFQPTQIDRMFGNFNLDYSPAYQAFDFITRVLSPYQFNPTDVNPLRDVLLALVDFPRLRQAEANKLFVSTTNVRTGKIRVFDTAQMSAEVLLASSCLPTLFHAVEIDGEHYWDGGFMGNPALFPLLYKCRASDIVLIEINPIRVDELPSSARAIIDRMNAISFNATMMREMRTIAFVTQMLEQHQIAGRSHLRQIHFHIIEAEKRMASFGVSSKFNVDWQFLSTLFELGRQTAEAWLERNFEAVGVKSSVDLQTLFF